MSGGWEGGCQSREAISNAFKLGCCSTLESVPGNGGLVNNYSVK